MRSRNVTAAAAICLGGLTVGFSGCGSKQATSSTATSLASEGSIPNGLIEVGRTYHPKINPGDFSAVVDNPWFPLKPGSVYTYEGVKDGQPSRDVYTVSRTAETVDGVPCVVISDLLYLSDRLFERTTDYYTQDNKGNVWYFGEETAELDASGNVTSTDGTWRAGQNGAQPGIFMEANPLVGRAFRQEYDSGNAEDQFKVVALSSPVKVPYGEFKDALMTEETTAIEPGVVDQKFYVKGVGEVAELSVKGPEERALLVSYQSG